MCKISKHPFVHATFLFFLCKSSIIILSSSNVLILLFSFSIICSTSLLKTLAVPALLTAIPATVLAKKTGDYLIVGLNSDNSVRRVKGEGRPINSEQNRAGVLSSLECVDYIVIFDEPSTENCLIKLKPDFYVKGGDYNINTINQPERKIVENYGGEIVLIPLTINTSTTKIIEKINK